MNCQLRVSQNLSDVAGNKGRRFSSGGKWEVPILGYDFCFIYLPSSSRYLTFNSRLLLDLSSTSFSQPQIWWSNQVRQISAKYIIVHPPHFSEWTSITLTRWILDVSVYTHFGVKDTTTEAFSTRWMRGQQSHMCFSNSPSYDISIASKHAIIACLWKKAGRYNKSI